MQVNRISLLQKKLPEWQTDALVIDAPVDLFYLTGLQVSAGRLYLTKTDAQLFVDGRYYTIAKEKSPVNVALLDLELQKQFLQSRSVQSLAFDSAATSYEQFLKWKTFSEKIPIKLLALSSPLKQMRAVKSPDEWEKMRKAAALAQAGVLHVVSLITPQVTEKKLAWEFEKYCREHGAEKMAFEPIIAFGENASFPHHHSSDRVWRKGETVLIDVGCVVDHYASDVTRTLWGMDIPSHYTQLQKVALEAYQAASAICRPGTRIGDLDIAARRVMQEAGVEDLFVHSLGHGIGLEIHEYPRISEKGDDKDRILEEGMVITIEPGLYAAGTCGIRHENTVIVKKEGVENLYSELGSTMHV